MASWCREGRPRGRPPPWASGREAVEYVPVRPPPQRLLDQLLRDLQQHLDEMEKMRAALLDAYPLFWAGRGGCGHRRPLKPEKAGPGPGGSDEEEDEEGGGGYRFSLDVAGFAPEELSVQLQGRRLTVRAKHDRRSEAADGCVSHEYREVRKEVALPDDADLEALACALDAGLLCVRAPRRPLPAAQPRDIPIAVGRAPASPAAPRRTAAGPEQERDPDDAAPPGGAPAPDAAAP